MKATVLFSFFLPITSVIAASAETTPLTPIQQEFYDEVLDYCSRTKAPELIEAEADALLEFGERLEESDSCVEQGMDFRVFSFEKAIVAELLREDPMDDEVARAYGDVQRRIMIYLHGLFHAEPHLFADIFDSQCM